jgi:hypothetical protein
LPLRWVAIGHPLSCGGPGCCAGPGWTEWSSGHEGGRGASDDAAVTLLRAVRTGRSCAPTPSTGYSPIGSFLRTWYLVHGPAANSPAPPNTARLGRRYERHAPADDGADAQPPAALPGWGSARPRSAVRSRSCPASACGTPRIQIVRAARDLGERGQRPFPGGGRRIGVGRRLGCSWSWRWPWHPCSLSGSWWLRGVADGGVVVLVDLAAVHVLPLLAIRERYWATWVCSCWCSWASWLWVSAMANHFPRGRACRNPTQVAGPASPRLTAKLTANRADNRGSWRTALDCYIRPELRRCGRR